MPHSPSNITLSGRTVNKSGVVIMPLLIIILVLSACGVVSPSDKADSADNRQTQNDPSWQHLSSANNDLPLPGTADRQTAALIFDINRDGMDDFVIGMEEAAPAAVWYTLEGNQWQRYLIEAEALPVEAGGHFHDIDGDDDLDLVLGAGWQTNEVWWWENPYPDFDPDTPWQRRLIKNSGGNKHHDMRFIDVDDDGRAELIFFTQKDEVLLMAEIPDDPRVAGPWDLTEVFSWAGMEDLPKIAIGEGLEGLYDADINGDGLADIIGGGRWFEYTGEDGFIPHVIDNEMSFARVAAGQLVEGGPPEVVMGCGDCKGPLNWYEWDGTSWIAHPLLEREIVFGHSLEVADLNDDGHQDIFVAEMGQLSDTAFGGAQMMVFLGDGQGSFTQSVIATGFGNHESKLGDLDGDGDLDIVGKPFRWQTPRVDLWLNRGGTNVANGTWTKHVLRTIAERMIFVLPGDLNGDGFPDVVAGNAWYPNPQSSDTPWAINPLPEMGQVALVHDFDDDGDLDLFGTRGIGAEPNSDLLWLENQGDGTDWIVHALASPGGDFLQGALVADLDDDDLLDVVLSWHDETQGLDVLTVPADATQPWPVQTLDASSLGEELNAADIDADGDLDLLLGTVWLANPGALDETWTAYTIGSTDGSPDRNALVDLNNDGRPDAVTGNEEIPTELVWFIAPADPTGAWEKRIIASNLGGVYSLDSGDLDDDGDIDLVLGEHKNAQRLLWFENQDDGATWLMHVLNNDQTHDHHDGTQLVDIDRDGDLDIISVGWTHNDVLLYVNHAENQ